MSDTPRTDAAEVCSEIVHQDAHSDGWIETDFARTLERELTAARAGLRFTLENATKLEAKIERLKSEIRMAYKEGWTEGFACDGHAVYGFEGQRDADFEKSHAKRISEGKE